MITWPRLPGWNFNLSSWDRFHSTISLAGQFFNYLIRFAWIFFGFFFVSMSFYKIEDSQISINLNFFYLSCLVFSCVQFARIHTGSLIKIEKTLNRPIIKFYNSDDVNVIAAELRLTKTRPTSFNKKHNLL